MDWPWALQQRRNGHAREPIAYLMEVSDLPCSIPNCPNQADEWHHVKVKRKDNRPARRMRIPVCAAHSLLIASGKYDGPSLRKLPGYDVTQSEKETKQESKEEKAVEEESKELEENAAPKTKADPIGTPPVESCTSVQLGGFHNRFWRRAPSLLSLIRTDPQSWFLTSTSFEYLRKGNQHGNMPLEEWIQACQELNLPANFLVPNKNGKNTEHKKISTLRRRIKHHRKILLKNHPDKERVRNYHAMHFLATPEEKEFCKQYTSKELRAVGLSLGVTFPKVNLRKNPRQKFKLVQAIFNKKKHITPEGEQLMEKFSANELVQYCKALGFNDMDEKGRSRSTHLHLATKIVRIQRLHQKIYDKLQVRYPDDYSSLDYAPLEIEPRLLQDPTEVREQLLKVQDLLEMPKRMRKKKVRIASIIYRICHRLNIKLPNLHHRLK